MTEPPEEPTHEQVQRLVDACPQAAQSADYVRITMAFDVPTSACASFFLDVTEAARRNGATRPDDARTGRADGDDS